MEQFVEDNIRSFVDLVCFTLMISRPLLVFSPLENKHASQSYQAFAHIVIGWLLAWWFLGHYVFAMHYERERNWLIVLSIVEVVSAGASIYLKKKGVKDEA